jgi:crotonobetainyl-CoA:carnitine CoA-transferase CaiB-like acyl-CoA transferase
LTSVLMGPYATQILGDLGADIIKVESPSGDTTRLIGPMRNPGMGPTFLNANRSKRSIVLDLKQPEGRAALLRLAESADVLIYNVRPKAMARLGLSYEDIKAINPKIIYVGLVGFGQSGPYADKPAYDDLIQGAVALPTLSTMAGSDVPRYVPATIADRTVGLHGAIATVAALLHRASTGRGQQIEIPMFETMAGYVLGDHMGGNSFEPSIGAPGYQRLLVPDRRPYRTSDGYICVILYTDEQWRNFFKSIGQGETVEKDERFANLSTRSAAIGSLYKIVADILLTRTSAEWLALLESADIPVMPLHTLESLIEDPHLKAVGFITNSEHPSEGPIHSIGTPWRWSDSQPGETRPAPRMGEHSVEILQDIGYDSEQIQALIESRITQDDGQCTRNDAYA